MRALSQEHARSQYASHLHPSPTPSPSTPSSSLPLLLARVDYWLGLNHLETEELSTGERLMGRAMAALLPHSTSFPVPVIDGHNALSLLHTSRARYTAARDALLIAQRTYQAVKPFHPSLPAGEWGVVENLHTLTLYYLAQVYGKMGKRSLSASFCHLCLKRQVEGGAAFDRREWVRNALGLAEYYQQKEQWEDAWHCIKAADAVIEPIQTPPSPTITDPDEAASDREKAAELRAELHRAFAAFHLALLQAEHRQPTSAPTSKSASAPAKRIRFTTLALPACPYPLPPVPIPYEVSLSMFNAAFPRVTRALAHWPLDGSVSEHIGLCQLLSALYRQLSLRDPVAGHAGAWLKKRTAPLLPCMEGLSAAQWVDLYREVSGELAKMYGEWMEVKGRGGGGGGRGSQKELGVKAIGWWEKWLATFNRVDRFGGEERGGIKAEEERECAREVLKGMMCVARLYGRLGGEGVEEVVANERRSWEWFERTVARCEELKAEDVFKEELAVCREMVELLPRKMQKLQRDGVASVQLALQRE